MKLESKQYYDKSYNVESYKHAQIKRRKSKSNKKY